MLRNTRPNASRKVTAVDVKVGQRIRLRRIIIGLKQEELAAAIGISYQQLQKYESGLSRLCASRLNELSEVLEAPLSWFFEDDQASDGPTQFANEALSEEHACAVGPSPRTVSGDGATASALFRRDTRELMRLYENLPSHKSRKLALTIVRFISRYIEDELE